MEEKVRVKWGGTKDDEKLERTKDFEFIDTVSFTANLTGALMVSYISKEIRWEPSVWAQQILSTNKQKFLRGTTVGITLFWRSALRG